MKRLLTLLIIGGVISAGCIFSPVPATSAGTPATNNSVQKMPTKEQMKQKFEKRLNLTEKQKEKAKIIHQKGREQMKPVMDQIMAKHQEIEAVQKTKMTEKAQQEKIAEINLQIRELDKKANEIRKANSQEFESILTKKQKNELAKMKAEGRAEFERNHPPRPPFQGLGNPGFFVPNLMSKPLFPPPPFPDFTNK